MQRTLNFLFNLGDEEERKELSISFLVDLSGSMIGEPLEKVKEALISLLSPLVLDDDGASPGADQVNLFTFHSTVQSVSPWVNKEDFDFFSECLLAIDNLAFTGSGATALYDGINACLDSFKNEKLKKSNEKIIVVFSDGGENASTQNKRDIDLKIKAFANGYLEKDDMALAKNLDNSIRKRLFVSYRDDADILVFNDDALHLLNSGDLIKNNDLRHKLIDVLTSSRMPVKVYSLLYSFDDDDTYLHPGPLKDFADLSNGNIHVSPNLDKIPQVLYSLMKDINRYEKYSFRQKLISQLKSASKETDFYRVININKSEDASKYFNQNWNEIKTSLKHPVYNYHLELNGDLKRSEHSKIASDKLLNPDNHIIEDLYHNLDSQNTSAQGSEENIEYSDFDKTPIVNLVLRGNDSFANLNAKNIVKLIFELKKNYFGLIEGSDDPFLSFNVFLLLSNFEEYNEKDKIYLRALLVELNSIFEKNKLHHKFILISDTNDSKAVNSHFTYKGLTNDEFEDHVIENLVNFNVYQGAIKKMEEDFDDKYKIICPGAISIKMNKTEILDKYTNKLAKDLLQGIIHSESYYPPKGKIDKSDSDHVISKVKFYLEDLKYAKVKSDFGLGAGLSSRFSCPDILSLTIFTKNKKLNYNRPDAENSVPQKNFFKKEYYSEVDYISRFLFDLKEYVESGNSVDFFRTFLIKKTNEFLENKTLAIRKETNKLFYQENNASPLKANYWIEQLTNNLGSYCEEQLVEDIRQDMQGIDSNLVKFQYKKTNYKIEADPNAYLTKLKKRIQTLPLRFALRLKYGFFAFVLIVGFLSLLIAMALPMVFYLFMLVPFMVYGFAEYKLYLIQKQVKLLTLSYYYSYRHKAIQKAYENLISTFSDMYEELLSRLSGNVSMGEFSDRVSEKTYYDYFDTSLRKRISRLYEINSLSVNNSTRFNLSISNLNIISPALNKDYTIFKLNEKSWKSILGSLLKEQVYERGFTDYAPPVIKLPMKPDLNGLSEDAKWKLELIEVVKERQYLLILVAPLTSEEETELLSLSEDTFWQKKIQSLIAQPFDKIKYKGKILSPWRNIAEYEHWLLKLNEFVKQQKETTEVDMSFLFKRWKEKYLPRKEFIRAVFLDVKLYLEHVVDEYSIWDFISESDSKILKDYILGTIEPALQRREKSKDLKISKMFISDLSFEEISNTYDAWAESYKSSDFKEFFHCKPVLKLPNEIRFMCFYDVPVDNSFILIDHLKGIIAKNKLIDTEKPTYYNLNELKELNVSEDELIDPFDV